MAAPTSGEGAARRKGLVSRTLERCRSGLGGGGGSSSQVAAGCFSVYVGPARERFVVRADHANHPLFRRLLDDAEREFGYAAQGPLALPCAVDEFLDVLWHMDHRHGAGDDDGAGEVPKRRSTGGGRAAGYRVLSSAKTSPASLFSGASPTAARRS